MVLFDNSGISKCHNTMFLLSSSLLHYYSPPRSGEGINRMAFDCPSVHLSFLLSRLTKWVLFDCCPYIYATYNHTNPNWADFFRKSKCYVTLFSFYVSIYIKKVTQPSVVSTKSNIHFVRTGILLSIYLSITLSCPSMYSEILKIFSFYWPVVCLSETSP